MIHQVGDTNNSGSRYTCNSSLIAQTSCRTFLVYRSNKQFQTLVNISALFERKSDELLQLNNLIDSPSEILKPGREVLIPITCYTIPGNTSFSEISCGMFEVCSNQKTLKEENPFIEGDLVVGVKVHVPLKCACPDNFYISNRIEYLVTYPFVRGDGPMILSRKFNISP
ncbi:hypothetical protein SLA2020_083370 [Shorea laevis]